HRGRARPADEGVPRGKRSQRPLGAQGPSLRRRLPGVDLQRVPRVGGRHVVRVPAGIRADGRMSDASDRYPVEAPGWAAIDAAAARMYPGQVPHQFTSQTAYDLESRHPLPAIGVYEALAP